MVVGILIMIIFTLKFEKNNGHEWITLKEIPIEKLEIKTKYGWVKLSNWDFIDKEIINL